MKNFFYFSLLILITSSFSIETAKYAALSEKDPLIGEWEWVKDPTGSPYQPTSDMDWIFMRFSVGDKQSMGAMSFDETKGFGCPSYFSALSNGSTITGMLSDCCMTSNKGKRISFNYEYDLSNDQLVIIVKGENVIYKRKK